MLEALALEIILKALIVKIGKEFERTHELKRLYGQIPDSIRRNLEACFIANVDSCGADITNSNALTLAKILDQSSKLFVSARYHYEAKGMAVDFGKMTIAFETLIEGYDAL